MDVDLTPEQAVSRDALLADIRRVFPARRPEPFPPLVLASWSSDAARAAEAFVNATDWTVLNGKWLDSVPNAPNGLTEARSFLSPAAMCFYLPAYLSAALAWEVDPMFSLTYGFDTRTRDQLVPKADPETCTGRACIGWASLTQAQAGVVVQYLEWRIAVNGPDFDSNAVEALTFFWRSRAVPG